jgi:hypothetical protein
MHGSRLLRLAEVVAFGREHDHFDDEFLSASLPAEAVDRSIAGGGRDPAAWVGWQAVTRPRAKGSGERLLDCVLGEVDVSKGADQGGDRPAGLLAEDPADRRFVKSGDRLDDPQSLRPRIRV